MKSGEKKTVLGQALIEGLAIAVVNDIQLIYFEGCPNAERAEALLVKLRVPFDVVKQDNLPEDSVARWYSSPSILVGKTVIYGQPIDGASSACSVERFDERVIEEKLRKALSMLENN